ncbi:MAG TPA: (4Fe-4S)-binding protein [Actinobacteria bacterium]|nr:(4Fe-4S)-binding protein [Actinomycetota bacterium]
MIISIASGKGGTGKTTISTNLAFSLVQSGRNVQLLDCDVEEPNAHIFLDLENKIKENVFLPVPQIDEEKCTLCGKCAEVCVYNALFIAKDRVMFFPQLCHSCGGCSYFCPREAISEIDRVIGEIGAGDACLTRGSTYGIEFAYGKLNIGEVMAPPLMRKLKKRIDEDKVVIIDAPPGTSCPMIEAVKGSDFCFLITEPTPFGLNDLKLAVETLKVLKIPFAVLINRWNEEYFEVDSYCEKENISIAMRIPLERKIAELYSRGILFSKELPEWQKAFCKLFDFIEALRK